MKQNIIMNNISFIKNCKLNGPKKILKLILKIYLSKNKNYYIFNIGE
jgi:hypothetical protein